MKRSLLPLPLLLLLVIIILIHSCSKNPANNLPDQKEVQAKEKELIAARIGKEGITRIIPLDKKLDYELADAQGHVIPIESLSSRKTHPDNISACDDNNSWTVTIQSLAISAGCNTGYQLSWTYTISTNNNIVQTNPYNSSYYTHGQIQVLDGSNAQVYYDDLAASSITDQGPDPSRSGYEIFTVVFSTASNMNSVWFASPYKFNMGAFIATDCGPDANNHYQNLLRLIKPITPLANICNRIDPIQNAVTSPLRFYGEDPIGTCPSTLALPDMQEIQYSTDGGFIWVGGASPSSTLSYYLPPSGAPFTNFLGSSHYGYVDPYGALELQITLPSGSYSVLVRCRNIKYNNPISSYPGSSWPLPNPGVNCCAGAWSAPMTYSVTY